MKKKKRSSRALTFLGVAWEIFLAIGSVLTGG
jgi:hypothetical protein